MIYYRRNKKILEEFQNKEDRELLVYKNVDDVRNFAFSIVYSNGYVEQFLRTLDLENHYLGMQLLYKSSSYLKKYLTYKLASLKIQHYAYEKLALQGNMVLANLTSNWADELGALLYLPMDISNDMKEFLRKYKESLSFFPDMSIYQDCMGEMNILCELGSGEHKEKLEKILK